MKLTIKLLPPYRRKDEPDRFTIKLEESNFNLRQLSGYLFREWQHKFNYPLFDQKNLLTAEFIVNGSHAVLETPLAEGDEVAVIPYICGG